MKVLSYWIPEEHAHLPKKRTPRIALEKCTFLSLAVCNAPKLHTESQLILLQWDFWNLSEALLVHGIKILSGISSAISVAFLPQKIGLFGEGAAIHPREHFGQTDKAALVTSPNNLHV